MGGAIACATHGSSIEHVAGRSDGQGKHACTARHTRVAARRTSSESASI
jgi:hypothetical protein